MHRHGAWMATHQDHRYAFAAATVHIMSHEIVLRLRKFQLTRTWLLSLALPIAQGHRHVFHSSHDRMEIVLGLPPAGAQPLDESPEYDADQGNDYICGANHAKLFLSDCV